MRTTIRSGGLTTRQAQHALRHLYLRSAASGFMVSLITVASVSALVALVLVLVLGSTAMGSPAPIVGSKADAPASLPASARAYAPASAHSHVAPIAPYCSPN